MITRSYYIDGTIIQQHQFTIFNYHVYRHDVYGVYIDIIILKSDYNCAGVRVAWADDDICRFVTPRDDARS